MIYRGPNQGITIYHDGIEKESGTRCRVATVSSSGIVKIGRLLDPPGSTYYGSVYLDELLFWNRQVGGEEIDTIMNMMD